MEITGTSAPTATTPDLASTNTSPTADFETFLTLLTTQMRNQDPLNPMESTQFVAQLATFTSVEQQIETNSKLDNLTAALTADDTAGLADWLGKSVATPGTAHWGGTPIEMAFDMQPPPGARLVVRDGFGEIVDDRSYAGGAWTGQLATGRELPHGVYGFELRSAQADGDRLIESPRIHATVTEARIGADGALLILEDGRQVPIDEIASVRD